MFKNKGKFISNNAVCDLISVCRKNLINTYKTKKNGDFANKPI